MLRPIQIRTTSTEVEVKGSQWRANYSSIDFWFIDDRQDPKVIIVLNTNRRHQPKSFVKVAFDALVDGPLGRVNFRKRARDHSYWYAGRFSS